MNERVTTALLPRRRTPHTAQLPTHPSFAKGSFPRVAPPRTRAESVAPWLLKRLAETQDVRYFTTLARHNLAVLARVSRDTP